MEQLCKICEAKLNIEEKFRGTCKECENAISNLVNKKIGRGYHLRKVRLKA